MNHDQVRERAYKIIERYREGATQDDLAAQFGISRQSVGYAITTHSRNQYVEIVREHRRNGKARERYELARKLWESGMGFGFIADRMGYSNINSFRRVIQATAKKLGLEPMKHWKRSD